jgi:TrwC relaxase
MFTFGKIMISKKSGKRVARYLREPALAISKGARVAVLLGRHAHGTWRRDIAPRLAMELGITLGRPPTEQELEWLMQARRADTGQKWTRQKRDVAAYDIHASPDKSVTLAIIFASSEAERIALQQAVLQAVDFAMRAFADRLGIARAGPRGAIRWMRGHVAWCLFQHAASRPTQAVWDGPLGLWIDPNVILSQDPQVHYHVLWLNHILCEDGQFRALDWGQLRHIKEFGAIFQAKLADLLRGLGVKVRLHPTAQAIMIDAVPDPLRTWFSKGQRYIEAKAQAHARNTGDIWETMPERWKRRSRTKAASRRISRQDGAADYPRWDDEVAATGFHYITCMTGEAPIPLTREQRMEQAYQFAARHLADLFQNEIRESFAGKARGGSSSGAKTRVPDQSLCIALEEVRHRAACSLIPVGIESASDVDAVVHMLWDRGIVFHGVPHKLVLPDSWDRISYCRRRISIGLEPVSPALPSNMGVEGSTPEDSGGCERKGWQKALVDGAPALLWHSPAGGCWIWTNPHQLDQDLEGEIGGLKPPPEAAIPAGTSGLRRDGPSIRMVIP